MERSLTIFKSIFDNDTKRHMTFSSWDALEQLLFDLSKIPGYKPNPKEKSSIKPSPLISPAEYKKGSTRSNDNVLCWSGWACLDVDDYEESFEEVLKKYESVYYVCYSTASSTKEKPKFRLVFPLTDKVPAEKISHFWFALNSEFGNDADKQTKDLSRMFYVPAQYPGAHNFIQSHQGPFINPVDLMSRHKMVAPKSNNFLDNLPPEMQKEIIEHRKNQMSNTDVTWNSYKDCPFVSRELVSEYMTISETGWYAMLYKIMVSIASKAIRRKYPITVSQIVQLCRQIDADTGNWYENRALDVEANRALEFAYRNAL